MIERRLILEKIVEIPDGTEEEREMYIALANKFGLKIAKTPKIPKPIPGKVKIIKVESTCSLCGAVTSEYTKMLKYTDNTWKRDEIINETEAGEILPLNLHKKKVDCCPGCEDFLMAVDKIELVRMITRSRSVSLISAGVKKALADMRKMEEEENENN